MTTYDDLAQASAALADPTTSPHDLMSIAQAYPSLWVDVAKHPNAYPDLLSWLASVGDDTVREAIATRGPSPEIPSPPPPPADEQPLDGSSADMEVQEDSTSPESGTSTDSTTTSSSVKDTTDFSSVDRQKDSSPTALMDATPSIPRTQPPLAGNNSLKSSWISTSKGKKILIGSGAGLLAVILAVVLIVTLVVIPHQRAEEVAAEQARIEKEHQTAVDAFTKAVSACTQANTSLTDAITHAQQMAIIDPSTLDDPSLIDSLNQAITTAQSVKTCVPPIMSDDTTTIQQQTTQLTTDTTAVTTSVSALAKVDRSITISAQTKKDQDAAAKATEDAKKKADQKAASQAAHTLTSSTTTSDGYSYTTTVTLTDWYKVTDTTGTTSAWNSVGGNGSWSLPTDSSGIISGDYGFSIGTFGTDKSAVIFGKMTVTNTTSGFALPPNKANPSLTIDPSDAHDELYKRTASKDIAFCLQFSSLKCNEAWGYPSWQMDSGKSQYISFYIVDGLAFSPTDPTGQGTVSQTLQLGPDAKTTLPGSW